MAKTAPTIREVARLAGVSVGSVSRVINGDPGLWEDGQIGGWRALVSHMKSYGAKAGIQLNHGGRKSSMQRAFRGNGPLTDRDLAMGEERWTPLAPSALPLAEGWLTPEEITADHLEGLADARAASSAPTRATARSRRANWRRATSSFIRWALRRCRFPTAG
jgi:2,4-dienoyl-CoA reductase-like NADH-dependent reductase (Old Yellow Enzyme family)